MTGHGPDHRGRGRRRGGQGQARGQGRGRGQGGRGRGQPQGQGRGRGQAVRQAAPGPADGTLVEVDVGAVTHAGACVARLDGRVLFVRHTLPGERVVARVTDSSHDRYWRADAVEVLRASPDRVPPPCPQAGPGRCGGCDWQHASLAAQRGLRAAVVAEALRRFAGVEADVEIEPVPAGDGDAAADGLGWRTRVRFAVAADQTVGLHGHRSHRVVPTPDCRIAHPMVVAAVAGRRFPGAEAVEVVASPTTGTVSVSVRPGRPARPGRSDSGRNRPDAGRPARRVQGMRARGMRASSPTWWKRWWKPSGGGGFG